MEKKYILELTEQEYKTISMALTISYNGNYPIEEHKKFKNLWDKVLNLNFNKKSVKEEIIDLIGKIGLRGIICGSIQNGDGIVNLSGIETLNLTEIMEINKLLIFAIEKYEENIKNNIKGNGKKI